MIRRLYSREHLDQVLATFALILILNQLVVLGFGRQPIFAALPQGFTGSVQLLPGLHYPSYRLLVIGAGLSVAGGLYLLINRTRIGMLVRAGANKPRYGAARWAWISGCFILWCSRWERCWQDSPAMSPPRSAPPRSAWASKFCWLRWSWSWWVVWDRSKVPLWLGWAWACSTR